MEQQNAPDEQIDLSILSKKIGGFFEKIALAVFNGIVFIKRNIVVLASLLVLGAVCGYFLDKVGKSYKNEVIVFPNFGTTDYLYAEIDLLNAKIEEGDTLFLKNTVGIKDTKKIGTIEIEPIPDIYHFIDNKEKNFELIKLMAEDGDIDKILEDKITSKNYTFHKISYTTTGKTSNEKTMKPIIDYLNNSKYYNQLRVVNVRNTEIKMRKNDSIIGEIDRFMATVSKKAGSSQNDKMVYYNENTQLNDVLRTRMDILNEQSTHRMDMINNDKIIKETSSTLNILDNSGVQGKLKIVLPFLLILLYLIAGFLMSFYKAHVKKYSAV